MEFKTMAFKKRTIVQLLTGKSLPLVFLLVFPYFIVTMDSLDFDCIDSKL